MLAGVGVGRDGALDVTARDAVPSVSSTCAGTGVGVGVGVGVCSDPISAAFAASMMGSLVLCFLPFFFLPLRLVSIAS